MPTENSLTRHEIPLTVEGTDVRLSCMSRAGEGLPLVFLHGFGSTKEDYADVVQNPDFAGRPVFAYDAPGCGESWCADLAKISIPFLVGTALTALAAQGIDRFHLVGHSMGGLTSLMLAHQAPGRVASFTDIEGNLAPEDCFLSRQIFLHPQENAEQFLEDFIARNWAAQFYSSQLYATSVRYKVRAGAVRGIFESMVQLSDSADLMATFLNLPMPRMFMYGEQNRSLSYLPHLAARGVQLAEIPRSGHFPMYSNAPEMWDRIAAFQRQADPAALQ
ncbi:alpha/beta hydrolase [Arthrobacter sp. Soil736]|uniref:alpha/beta fold hydrolase n=1 Tax=Arthrobacter sp. Soil736 TaxID=1736395 RepID=UPI0007003CFF|nr:alpha/beta fold hydrolase [Arthrobacter sp. Soil736]KRE64240.1 alpha/beta hydrolase [Arthrobacter sp. Soil736]